MRPESGSERSDPEPGGQAQEMTRFPGRLTDPSRPLRIGTLSWSKPRRDSPLLAADHFLASLEQLHTRSPEPWDLLLASGRTIAGEPPAQEVLARMVGSAVIFEVINPDQSTARWVLAHGDPQARSDRVRTDQILVRGGDAPATYDRLAAELARGGGVIRIKDSDTKLVLLICGENNALNTHGRGRSALCRPGPGLSDNLGGRWIALNPAHSPYWGQSRMTGFAKVGRVGGVGETMARTVADRGPYADGTSPPIAFIHANNFFADEPKTRAYASVAFGPRGRLAPEFTIEGEVPPNGNGEPLHWLAASYRIPICGADLVDGGRDSG